MMQTGSHFDDIGARSVVDHIRESARQHPAELTMGDRTQLGREHQEFEYSPQLVSKLRTEPRALALIPAVRTFNI